MIWVIGDIHGMSDPLKRILNTIRKLDNEKDPVEKIIFIGDYIDHGPSSKEVIDLISKLEYEKVLLVGNHEDLALRYVKNDRAMIDYVGYAWLNNGAIDTYTSFFDDLYYDQEVQQFTKYCNDASHARITKQDLYENVKLPNKLIKFLSRLKYSHQETIKIDSENEVTFDFFHGLPECDQVLVKQQIKTYRDYNSYLLNGYIQRHPYCKTQDRQIITTDSRRAIQNSFLWSREYDHTKGYEGHVIIHGHTPTLFYEDYYYTDDEDDHIKDQFEQFPKLTPLPFIYSRSPSKSIYYNRKSLNVDREYNIRDLHNFTIFDNCIEYITCDKYGIEAINIDTGAVYGGELTALGLSRHFLSQNVIPIISYDVKSNQRDTPKFLKKIIIFNKLGGPVTSS
jgi:calcineurin-like phosphoesterase family protein